MKRWGSETRASEKAGKSRGEELRQQAGGWGNGNG